MGIEKIVENLIPAPVLDNGKAIKIFPLWEDDDMYKAINNLVRTSERYTKVESESFEYPENPLKKIDSSASFEELHREFDKGILSKVYMMAQKRGSDIVFLNNTRGFGYLGINAHFYRTNE